MENKRILIIGGTGTLGKELIRNLYRKNKISVLSRDEHKQALLKKEYPFIKFYLGDIRNLNNHDYAFHNIDVVFHVAALKHVDILENDPLESIKTNVLGSINIAEACIRNNVKYCMFSSTDKAVYPINAYGMSKGLSEKIFLDYNKKQSKTLFKVYRWPNVIGSNGSALLFFIVLIKSNKTIPITDARMSRFWLKTQDAINFVLDTIENNNFCKDKVLIYPHLKAAPLLEVIGAISYLLKKDYKYNVIGLRAGEKLHEDMCFENETGRVISSNNCDQYTKEELLELLKDLVLCNQS